MILAQEVEASSIQAGNQVRQFSDTLNTQFQYIFYGVCLLALLISLVVANVIVRPISGAIQSAEKIAGGQLDFDIKTTGQGETKKLLHALKTMREAILERNREARKMADTELETIRICPASDDCRGPGYGANSR